MPPPAKPPRLWLRPERRDAAGKIINYATWIILDRGRQHPTGCAEREVEAAGQALERYLATKHQPARKRRDIEDIDVADVLSLYTDDCLARGVLTKRMIARLDRLGKWWGGKTLAEVNGTTCRAYAAHKGNRGGARRDLEDLRSAINYHAKEGFHREMVKVTLPEKGAPRDRWLTRSEAAKLIWTCWRYREKQRRDRGDKRAERLPTDKRPLRHIARFILIGLYSGTRAAAIAAASPHPKIGRSYVDLDNGVFYRLQIGARQTKKRQPPVRIAPRLLAHLRRWHAKGVSVEHFVEWNGKPVKSVKTGFRSAVEKSGIEGAVSPHTLRHTAATWLMQNGCDLAMAAGYLGMTLETIETVYAHHHPDHQSEAVDSIGARPQKRHSLVVSLEEARAARDRKELSG